MREEAKCYLQEIDEKFFISFLSSNKNCGTSKVLKEKLEKKFRQAKVAINLKDSTQKKGNHDAREKTHCIFFHAGCTEL